ncbi:MAG: glycosyltransferase family A protein, partial [Nitrospirales bacterium]
QLSRPGNGLWRFIIDPIAIVIFRLILTKGSIKRFPGSIRVVYENILNKTQNSNVATSEITAYVRATEKEEPLIRTCLLARSLKMYGVAIEPLIQRMESGLPSTQTKSWLSYFLREIGDAATADVLCPNESQQPDSPNHQKPSRPAVPRASGSDGPDLKYALIITSMFDSGVFRSSLSSLVNSDFCGEIVVVEEGNQPEKVCESYCREMGVSYHKKPSWTGPDASFNLGIQNLESEPDILINAHSDVLWPPSWFARLDEAWARVYSLDKVSMINLGYIDFSGEPSLAECFVQGRYMDLIDVFAAIRDAGSRRVKYTQVQDPSRMFGLGRDLYSNDKPEKLHRMAGRYSVGASYPMQAWRDIGGFDPELGGSGLDNQLLLNSIQNRKWQVWTNNSLLIHHRGTDTGLLSPSNFSRHIEIVGQTYSGFAKKYGWNLDHFLSTYYGETCIIYGDEIVDAVNELRFSDIDFVFDEFADRLARKRLNNCELPWCRARATCEYV